MPDPVTARSSIGSGAPLARRGGFGSPEHLLSAECRQVIRRPHWSFGPGRRDDDLTDHTAVGQFVGYETEDEGDEHGGQGVLWPSHPRTAFRIGSDGPTAHQVLTCDRFDGTTAVRLSNGSSVE